MSIPGTANLPIGGFQISAESPRKEPFVRAAAAPDLLSFRIKSGFTNQTATPFRGVAVLM
jgi:hypothetical protein